MNKYIEENKMYYTFYAIILGAIMLSKLNAENKIQHNNITNEQNHYHLALDLGSGYFKAVLAEVNTNNKIEKIIFEKFAVILMGDEFNQINTISKETEIKAVKAVKKFVDESKEIAGNSTLKVRGVATAVFRKAGDRGKEVLGSINDAVGAEFIKELTAEQEGKLGLSTARMAFAEKYPNNPLPNVCWDSGNMSFQITYQTNDKKIFVLEGGIGSADVQSQYAVSILGYDKYDFEKTKYQPVSTEQIEKFLSMVLEQLPQSNKEFLDILIQEQYHIVTFGGKDTIFGMIGGALGKTKISIENVKEFLNRLADRKELDEKLLDVYGAWAPYIIPRTVLLYAVMSYYGIESFEDFNTLGTTKGLLLIPELWE